MYLFFHLLPCFFIIWSIDASELNKNKKIHIHGLDKHLDISSFKGTGPYQLHNEAQIRQKKSFLPMVAIRDQIFKEALIDKKISTWDHLDKDLFYMKLKKSPYHAIMKKYPQFLESEVKALKSLIKEYDHE